MRFRSTRFILLGSGVQDLSCARAGGVQDLSCAAMDSNLTPQYQTQKSFKINHFKYK
jgi:hypothetical protein